MSRTRSWLIKAFPYLVYSLLALISFAIIAQIIFIIVYGLLMLASQVTGLTYNEVNIVTYYILIPFVYVALADKIWGKNVLKVLYIFLIAITLYLIPNFAVFSDWLFDESVKFLLFFRVIGWSYVVSSVLICVIFPGILFLFMLHRAYPKLLPAMRQKYFNSKKAKNKKQV